MSDPCEDDGLALRQDGGTISFTEGYAEDKVRPPHGAAPHAVRRQGLGLVCMPRERDESSDDYVMRLVLS